MAVEQHKRNKKRITCGDCEYMIPDGRGNSWKHKCALKGTYHWASQNACKCFKKPKNSNFFTRLCGMVVRFFETLG